VNRIFAAMLAFLLPARGQHSSPHRPLAPTAEEPLPAAEAEGVSASDMTVFDHPPGRVRRYVQPGSEEDEPRPGPDAPSPLSGRALASHRPRPKEQMNGPGSEARASMRRHCVMNTSSWPHVVCASRWLRATIFALFSRTRSAAASGRVLDYAVQVQSRISGMSWPWVSMYRLCSTSLSAIACLR
jgi:hypothetical protein